MRQASSMISRSARTASYNIRAPNHAHGAAGPAACAWPSSSLGSWLFCGLNRPAAATCRWCGCMNTSWSTPQPTWRSALSVAHAHQVRGCRRR